MGKAHPVEQLFQKTREEKLFFYRTQNNCIYSVTTAQNHYKLILVTFFQPQLLTYNIKSHRYWVGKAYPVEPSWGRYHPASTGWYPRLCNMQPMSNVLFIRIRIRRSNLGCRVIVGVVHEEFSVKWAFKIGKSRQIKQKSHKVMCFWVVTIHRRVLMKR